MPNYVRNIVLEKLGNLWALSEDRQRIKRRLGALQNLSLMKNNIKNELENIKNGLSGSNVGLECGGEKILIENCNGKCYQTNASKGKSRNFTCNDVKSFFIIFAVTVKVSFNKVRNHM